MEDEGEGRTTAGDEMIGSTLPVQTRTGSGTISVRAPEYMSRSSLMRLTRENSFDVVSGVADVPEGDEMDDALESDFKYSRDPVESIYNGKSDAGEMMSGPDDESSQSRQRDAVIQAEVITVSWEDQKFTGWMFLGAYLTVYVLLCIFCFPRIATVSVSGLSITDIRRTVNNTGLMKGALTLQVYSPNFFRLTVDNMKVKVYDSTGTCAYTDIDDDFKKQCEFGHFVLSTESASSTADVDLASRSFTTFNLPFELASISNDKITRLEKDLATLGSDRDLSWLWLIDTYYSETFPINVVEHLCQTTVQANSTTLPISASYVSGKCREDKGISDWIDSL